MIEDSKLSVVMGVYNIANLSGFDKSMQSVLRQRFYDFEFVICDDGSLDTTYDILKKYAETDSRIVIVRNEINLGLAAALNKCIASAHGEYIARQDADDFSNKDRFFRQLEFLELNREIDFVGSSVELFDSNGVWGKRATISRPDKVDFLFTNPFVHGSIMMRRDSVVRAGCYRVSKATRRAEDYDLFMRMYSMGMRGANLNDCFYSYREDSANLAKRKYCYRVDEMLIRFKGFKALGLLPWGLFFCLKPLVVGIIPKNFLRWIRIQKTGVKDVQVEKDI